MKSIKEKAEEWGSKHSNKGCTEQCNGCWLLNKTWGCEQYNMETAYKAGANYVLDAIAVVLNQPMNDYLVLVELKELVEQLKEK